MVDQRIPSPPYVFTVSPSHSLRDRLYCFLHNLIHHVPLRNEIPHPDFFQKYTAEHLNKVISIRNSDYFGHFRDACCLLGTPGLACIEITISTQNQVKEIHQGFRIGPFNKVVLERQYKLIVEAKFFNYGETEVKFLDERTQEPLDDIREVYSWSTPHPSSPDMGPFLGTLFDWPCIVELLKHNARKEALPPGMMSVESPLAHMGILGQGEFFRAA